jgi:hypothetical protein
MEYSAQKIGASRSPKPHTHNNIIILQWLNRSLRRGTVLDETGRL